MEGVSGTVTLHKIRCLVVRSLPPKPLSTGVPSNRGIESWETVVVGLETRTRWVPLFSTFHTYNIHNQFVGVA